MKTYAQYATGASQSGTLFVDEPWSNLPGVYGAGSAYADDLDDDIPAAEYTYRMLTTFPLIALIPPNAELVGIVWTVRIKDGLGASCTMRDGQAFADGGYVGLDVCVSQAISTNYSDIAFGSASANSFNITIAQIRASDFAIMHREQAGFMDSGARVDVDWAHLAIYYTVPPARNRGRPLRRNPGRGFRGRHWR